MKLIAFAENIFCTQNVASKLQTTFRPKIALQTILLRLQIDIGGVTLLRAAAKNHARVIVLCDPADYKRIGEKVGWRRRRARCLAAKRRAADVKSIFGARRSRLLARRELARSRAANATS